MNEEEKNNKAGSMQNRARIASSRFRRTMTKKGRRSSKVMSIDDEIDDDHVEEESKAVENLRKVLALEDLLPSQYDDYHMLLRFLIN